MKIKYIGWVQVIGVCRNFHQFFISMVTSQLIWRGKSISYLFRFCKLKSYRNVMTFAINMSFLWLHTSSIYKLAYICTCTKIYLKACSKFLLDNANKLKNKIYHTIGTVPKSKTGCHGHNCIVLGFITTYASEFLLCGSNTNILFPLIIIG
jgi:hypothetical protein